MKLILQTYCAYKVGLRLYSVILSYLYTSQPRYAPSYVMSSYEMLDGGFLWEYVKVSLPNLPFTHAKRQT